MLLVRNMLGWIKLNMKVLLFKKMSITCLESVMLEKSEVLLWMIRLKNQLKRQKQKQRMVINKNLILKVLPFGKYKFISIINSMLKPQISLNIQKMSMESKKWWKIWEKMEKLMKLPKLLGFFGKWEVINLFIMHLDLKMTLKLM